MEDTATSKKQAGRFEEPWKRFKENWVKHTPAGEMPDSSRPGELKRRMEADAAVAPEIFRARTIALSLLAAVGIGVGAYFLWDRYSSSRYPQAA